MLLMLINQQRGSAAIAAIITMIVLGLLGTAFVTLSTTELRIATAHRDGVAAQYLAEAGAMWARIQLHGDVDQSKMFYNATNSASGKTYPAVTKNTGTATQGTYTVTVSQDSVGHAGSSDWRKIVSVGNVNGAKRTVSLVINLKANPLPTSGVSNGYSSLFENVFFSGNNMIFQKSTISGKIYSKKNITGDVTSLTGTAQAEGNVTATGILPAQILAAPPSPAPIPNLANDFQNYYYNASAPADRFTGNKSISGTFNMANKVYFIDGNLTFANQAILQNMGIFYVTGNITFGNGITMDKVLMIAGGKKSGSVYDITTGNITIPNNSTNSGSAMLIAQNTFKLNNNANLKGIFAAFGVDGNNDGQADGTTGTLDIGKSRITYDADLLTAIKQFEATLFGGGITSWNNF